MIKNLPAMQETQVQSLFYQVLEVAPFNYDNLSLNTTYITYH